MSEPTELNVLLTSYSMQDNALEQSSHCKTENYKMYQEALEEYKTVKKEFLEIDEKHRISYTEFAQMINTKNLFNNLQITPNSKISNIQGDILKIYQVMSKDSDDFVDSVNTCVTKLQNLGTEFDESAIQKNKCKCCEKTEVLSQKIKEKESIYSSLQPDQIGCNQDHEIIKFNEKNPLKLFFGDLFKITTEIFEKEQHLLLLEKNVDFLQKRNEEARMQCSAFSY